VLNLFSHTRTRLLQPPWVLSIPTPIFSQIGCGSLRCVYDFYTFTRILSRLPRNLLSPRQRSDDSRKATTRTFQSFKARSKGFSGIDQPVAILCDIGTTLSGATYTIGRTLRGYPPDQRGWGAGAMLTYWP